MMRGVTRSRKAFTLVEVIVVSVILSILAAGVGAAFMSGMRVWDRAKSGNFERNLILLTLESLARELRQTLLLNDQGLKGTATGLDFVTFSGDRLVVMDYHYDEVQQQWTRAMIPLNDWRKEESLSEREPAGNWDRLELAYLAESGSNSGEMDWENEWAREKELPAAVRLEVARGAWTYQKVVFLPVSGKGWIH